MVYLPIPDSSVRLANLEAGGIEMSEYVIPTDVDAVKRNPKLRLATSDGLGYQTVAFNLANGPRAKTTIGQDARVRRAFQYALDRTALVQVVYNGLYAPTAQAGGPTSPFYDKALQPQERDVAKARALLKEAGVATPVVVQMTIPINPDLRQVGEIIQSMAAEAGFDVRLTASEYASALSAANRGDFEAFVTAWSGRVDPDGNLYSFLHTGAPLNDGHYSNPTVDQALDKARTVSDVPQRVAIYNQMWTQEAQDLPILYLWQLKNIQGLSAKVQGFTSIPDGMIRLQGVSLAN